MRTLNRGNWLKCYQIMTMEIYDTELGEFPFPRSIESIKALAMLNGAKAGVRYAEAFHLIKCIVR